MPTGTPLQKITASGALDWIGMPPITTQPGMEPSQGEPDQETIAYVAPMAPTPTITVADPTRYTPSVAAHESSHVWQNTRNPDFVSNAQAEEPLQPIPSDYDYGGVSGLLAHPLKSIGDYNPEQQATMVEDLTKAQSLLHPGMSRQELEDWDRTKNALERPIQQLKDIPPASNSLLERIDSHLEGHPLERFMGLLSTPSMPVAPQAVPGPPSAALGYALPSKLVK